MTKAKCRTKGSLLNDRQKYPFKLHLFNLTKYNTSNVVDLLEKNE